jgi:BCD family chlorophyll transporter-like MFS transporter
MTGPQGHPTFGWLGIIRVGLVQTSLGAIVILMTSTLNRVMAVELGLAAAIPGALVGWHYAVQMSRPRWGYGADTGAGRTPWILGGMAVLALGAFLAAASTAVMDVSFWPGLTLAIFAYLLIGVGVGASGTNLLALLAIRTQPDRKAPAAAIVWIMMIFGFVLTASIGGELLKPFSFERLMAVTAGVGLIALSVTALALYRLERPASVLPVAARPERTDFRAALREVWGERDARRFTIFVFASMLAYSMQDLILEPFAGIVHGYSAGASTQLSGVQNSGTLLGMLLTALIGWKVGRSRARFMRLWTVAGCIASAIALIALSLGTQAFGARWPLIPNVLALGAANGAFAVAAIGSMMTLASQGRSRREGTRMGLWGAAQAIAFGLGGFLGTVALDLSRLALGDPASAFALVFGVEGLLFILAAWLATRVGQTGTGSSRLPLIPAGEFVITKHGDPT